MKELKLLKQLLALSHGSARDAREELLAKLIADVRIDQDAADAPARRGQGAADLRCVVMAVYDKRAPAFENLQLVDDERAVIFDHLFEFLQARCVDWDIELVSFFTCNQALRTNKQNIINPI